MKNSILKITNEKGEEKEFDILFTFDRNKKSFIVYTDYSEDENGKLKTYASFYNSGDDFSKLDTVTEADELEIVNNFLNSIEDDIKAGIEF